MDIQDFVGQSAGAATKESAAAWVGYLKQNWSSYLNGVQINAEQFTKSADGTIIAGDPGEVPLRESYYAGQNIELAPRGKSDIGIGACTAISTIARSTIAHGSRAIMGSAGHQPGACQYGAAP